MAFNIGNENSIAIKKSCKTLKSTQIQINLIYLIIISLAVAPAFALGDGNRNLSLIGVMGLTPIVIFAFSDFYKLDIWLILLMVSLALAPLLNHPETMRWSTVLYSWMFCLSFMAYNRLLYTNVFSVIHFYKLLKFLILAYFITLLIQQFCVLTGMPVFNLSNYNIKEPWKLNSLSAEPSHSGRILALLFYCFISIKEILLNRSYNLKKDAEKDKWVWLGFLWTMITMGSATAFVFILIVFLKFIQRKNIIPLVAVSLLAIVILGNSEIDTIDRLTNTIQATLTLDPDKVIAADHSASFRIVPTMVLITMVEIFSFNGLLGHGVDTVSLFLYQYIPGGGKNVSGGGFLHIWYEYGFLSFVFLLVFSLKSTIYKDQLINLVFWFMLIFVNGINSQIVWLCIILLFTNNYFSKNINLKNANT